MGSLDFLSFPLPNSKFPSQNFIYISMWENGRFYLFEELAKEIRIKKMGDFTIFEL